MEDDIICGWSLLFVFGVIILLIVKSAFCLFGSWLTNIHGLNPSKFSLVYFMNSKHVKLDPVKVRKHNVQEVTWSLSRAVILIF
jgi:hypothetical protein